MKVRKIPPTNRKKSGISVIHFSQQGLLQHTHTLRAWRCEGEDILMEILSSRGDTPGGFQSGKIGWPLPMAEVI